MAEIVKAYIGLGSNLGDRDENLRSALDHLSAVEGVREIRVSSVMETAPLANADQCSYLNSVAEIKTELPAKELLTKLFDIEKRLGREPGKKWSSRVIDLDLLLYGEHVIEEADLQVPHRQMHLRSFVLKGLCELDSSARHPVLDETVSELAARLNGGDFFFDEGRPQLVSLAGQIGVGKTTLGCRLSKTLSAEMICEQYDENPYLPEVYAGKTELALDAQLYFLDSRVRQLSLNNLEAGKPAVSDYIFEKELIYAGRLLDDKQMSLYRKMYDNLSQEIVKPVLVLYLRDSVANCLSRIKKRNRPYERNMDVEFLVGLESDYESLFSDYCQCPVIRLDMDDFDPYSETSFGHLAKQIRYYTAIKNS